MKVRSCVAGVSALLLLSIPNFAFTTTITEKDSTQPRGAPLKNAYNDQHQLLDPVYRGFLAPRHVEGADEYYSEWAGITMANAFRDPVYFSAVFAANNDLIRLINSMSGQPNDPATPLGAFLQSVKLEKDIYRAPDGSLQPEDKLPVAADLCLRCHSPVGWLEAHSEPATSYFPFLKGDFWATKFVEYVHPVDLSKASEAEMEGVQCQVCHRSMDNYKRVSLYDGKSIPAGNGGFLLDRNDNFHEDGFHQKAEWCGTCHDVTNPLIRTYTTEKTAAGPWGPGKTLPDMKFGFERTYTEWYYSSYQSSQKCQECHEPMSFPGAQTWLLYPGLDALWGPVDQKYGNGSGMRTAYYQAARNRSISKLQSAANVAFVQMPTVTSKGQPLTVKVQVTNNAGHKLPTGFPEGRQMWLHIKAVDGSGKVVFEDGVMDPAGERLIRTAETKVYESVPRAVGYDPKVISDSGHFHAILFNFVEKDNRIPPKGFNKNAYMANGAFIIPRDPKDTDYPSGQNWDVTPYTFTIPTTATGSIKVTAELKYQSITREFVDFQKANDTEKTQAFGGRARNLPPGPYQNFQTWGTALDQLYKDVGNGPAVTMKTASYTLSLR